jgi:hypothetical protein
MVFDKDPGMTMSTKLAIASLLLCILVAAPLYCHAADVTQPSDKWKITSIRVCRTSGGSIDPMVDAIGTYPVYTFFIPRPVWTVNGNLVDATPIYQHGRLIAFRLMNAATHLKSGTKNTVKFALPDQNSSRAFLFEQSAIPAGDCYEFF